MEVTWRQEGWAQPLAMVGAHSPACAAMGTWPSPQWLCNLKGIIPWLTPNGDKSQVFEHGGESRGALMAGLRFALHLMWRSPNHQEKHEGSRAAVPSTGTSPRVALALLPRAGAGLVPSLAHTAQPQAHPPQALQAWSSHNSVLPAGTAAFPPLQGD